MQLIRAERAASALGCCSGVSRDGASSNATVEESAESTCPRSVNASIASGTQDMMAAIIRAPASWCESSKVLPRPCVFCAAIASRVEK